jgi:hypothetical protein
MTQLNFSPYSTLHLTFSTSKRIILTEITFSRRKNGQFLGIFVALNLNLNLYLLFKYSVCSYCPALSSLPVFGLRSLSEAVVTAL